MVGQVRVKDVTLPAVVPIKGHLIGFQMEPGALGPTRRHGETYVLQRSNGFLIAGSNEQDIGFDRTVDAAICEDIHRRAAQIISAARTCDAGEALDRIPAAIG